MSGSLLDLSSVVSMTLYLFEKFVLICLHELCYTRVCKYHCTRNRMGHARIIKEKKKKNEEENGNAVQATACFGLARLASSCVL